MTVTEGAKTRVKDHLKLTYLYMGLGAGGDSTNPNATDLDSPLNAARVSVVAAESGTSSIDYKGTFDGSNFTGQTIKEVGIFDALTGGNMLSRVNYAGIGPVTATDTFDIIITMEVE